MQDVPAALDRKGLAFACYMDPRRPAICDSDHAVRINYETYLFADRAARARFLEDVLAHCGMLTDPVTKRRFRPDASSPHTVDEDGVRYWFEGRDSFEMFLAMPEGYRLPGYVMPPADGARATSSR